jgi:secretory phospholipase A2
MKLLFFLIPIIILINNNVIALSINDKNSKNLIQFMNMINSAIELSAFWNINGYGCWCGDGGYGTPVDQIDTCCQIHDKCYDRVEQVEKCSPKIFNLYSYESNGNQIKCNDPTDSCNYKVCLCDKQATDCFKSNQNAFNSFYSNINWSLFVKKKTCQCQSGTYLQLNECKKCPSLYYNDLVGQISISACKSCPKGYICPNEGTINPQICPAGTRAYNNYECKLCPIQQYQDTEGGNHDTYFHGKNIACKSCPRGYICPQEGTVTPKICPAGTRAYNNYECKICPIGSYQDTEGGNWYTIVNGNGFWCYSCPRGHICPEEGTINPKICPAGTRAYNNYECKICPIGSYQDTEGGYWDTIVQGNGFWCKSCPNGYICPNIGTINPIPKP